MKKLLLVLAGAVLGVLALACFFGGPPDLFTTPLGVLFALGSARSFKAAERHPRPWKR